MAIKFSDIKALVDSIQGLGNIASTPADRLNTDANGKTTITISDVVVPVAPINIAQIANVLKQAKEAELAALGITLD